MLEEQSNSADIEAVRFIDERIKAILAQRTRHSDGVDVESYMLLSRELERLRENRAVLLEGVFESARTAAPQKVAIRKDRELI